VKLCAKCTLHSCSFCGVAILKIVASSGGAQQQQSPGSFFFIEGVKF
jgi:hypothetical protein